MEPDNVEAPAVAAAPRTKTIHNRAIVQVVDADTKTFRIVEDLGPVPTLKATSAKRKLEKAGQTDLAVIYWVG